MKTAILLAGGRSRRMGRDKLMLPQDGATVLESAVARFARVFDRVCVSVDRTDRYPQIAAEHISDVYTGCGPLAGIHAGLRACGPEGAFFAAADLPFSDPELALRLMDACPEDCAICVAAGPDGRPEPLFGYYRGAAADAAEELLKSGSYRIRDLFALCPTRILDLGAAAPDLAFANVNTPEEYAALLGDAGAGK